MFASALPKLVACLLAAAVMLPFPAAAWGSGCGACEGLAGAGGCEGGMGEGDRDCHRDGAAVACDEHPEDGDRPGDGDCRDCGCAACTAHGPVIVLDLGDACVVPAVLPTGARAVAPAAAPGRAEGSDLMRPPRAMAA